MARIHVLQHVAFEGPGFVAHWAEHRGYALQVTRLDLGEALPGHQDYDLLVVMGGPMGVHDGVEHPWIAGEVSFVKNAIENGKRVLGICLGAQIMAHAMGAPVVRNREREIGWFPIQKDPSASGLVADVFPDRFWAMHWHGETFGIPAGAAPLGESEACANQGFLWQDRCVGLQFHLESTQESVQALLDNCASDLVKAGAFVQGRSRILAGLKEHAKQVNSLMARLLDQLIVR